MFANQMLREAIQNLEQLKKVVLNDSSNDWDRILYEIRSDGRTKEPPQPAPKPGLSPRRHIANADARALPEFKPDRTPAEAMKHLPSTQPSILQMPWASAW